MRLCNRLQCYVLWDIYGNRKHLSTPSDQPYSPSHGQLHAWPLKYSYTIFTPCHKEKIQKRDANAPLNFLARFLARAVDASSRRGRLPLSALLVHSASPHLANRVKPRWLPCRVVCRHCGTLFSLTYEILENPLQQQCVVREVQHKEGCECKVSGSQCLMGTWWFILYMMLNVSHGSLLKCN